jgi:hypothetical protein
MIVVCIKNPCADIPYLHCNSITPVFKRKKIGVRNQPEKIIPVKMLTESIINNSPFGEYTIVFLLYAGLESCSVHAASGKCFSDASLRFHVLHQAYGL